MFVQVIQAKVSDPTRVRAALDEWMEKLAPGADGWLGTTTGVTEDGQVIAVVRFESEEAARQNSDRAEQGEWWSRISELFTGDATFRESRDVVVDLAGDPNDAGFVQVMQGRTRDPERAKELMSQDSTAWADFRPDIIGSVASDHDDGTYTMVLYFTSEEAAREGERKEPPPELKAVMAEMDALSDGVPDFYDLKDPWFFSPR